MITYVNSSISSKFCKFSSYESSYAHFPRASMSITGPPRFFFVVDVFAEFYNWIIESEFYSCIFFGLGEILIGELIETAFNYFKV